MAITVNIIAIAINNYVVIRGPLLSLSCRFFFNLMGNIPYVRYRIESEILEWIVAYQSNLLLLLRLLMLML